MSECTHDHSDLKLPVIPKPSGPNMFCATTIIIQGTNVMGLDKPVMVLSQPDNGHTVPGLVREGVTVVTCVVLDPTDNTPIGSATLDIPHTVGGINVLEAAGNNLADVWALVSEAAVQVVLMNAINDAIKRLAAPIVGTADTKAIYEWMEANMPPSDCGDPEGTGFGWLVKQFHARKDGVTPFQLGDYGQAVKFVTTEGWDAYLAYLEAKGDMSMTAQLDTLPEYVDVTFGLRP